MSTEEGWIAWQRYLDNKALKQEPEIEIDPSGDSHIESTVVQDLVPKTFDGIKSKFSLVYSFLIVALIAYVAISAVSELRPASPINGNAFRATFSASPSKAPDINVSTSEPIVISNRPLVTGAPWDVYLTYFVECALDESMGYNLRCSSNGQSLFVSSDGSGMDLVNSNWLKNERTRQLVCANGTFGIKTNVFGNFEEVDKYNEIQIDEKNGLLVTANLVAPPKLELSTISHEIIKSDADPYVITPQYSGGDDYKAIQKQMLETYAGGYCVAHFHVNQMPKFSSALKLYFPQGKLEWNINADEAMSNNFIFYDWSSDNHYLDLWNSKNYSSLVDVFSQ